MLGVKGETINQLVNDIRDIMDPTLRNTLLFAVKCSRDPQSLTTEDFDSLRRGSITQSQTVEIIAMSALAVYANIIADATAMEPDEMFNPT